MVVPAILALLVVAVYSPAIHFDFIYDDHKLIVEQAPARSIADVLRVFRERHWHNLPYYRPVVRATMVVQQWLHGNDPPPFHALNVVLMAAMMLAALDLLRRPAFGIRPFVAVVAAVLFAVHPIASCTVYPICSGRETLMPTLFIVAAVSAYLRPGGTWRLAALALFAVALLCKEMAVIVPLLFFAADALGLTANAPPRRTSAVVRHYAPLAAILAAYFLIRWSLFHGTHEHRLALLDEPSGPLFSLLFAVQNSWLPFADLVYEPPVSVWMTTSRLLFGLAATAALVASAFRTRRTTGAVNCFWAVWFLLSLLPTANILAQEAPFAERYLFLPSLGVIGALATQVSTLCTLKAARQLVAVGSCVLLTVCATVSLHRGQFFRDDLSFLSQWVRVNPRSDQAHRSLGWALFEAGRLPEAEQHLLLSIELNPQNPWAYEVLGNVLAREGRVPAAVAAYEQALEVDPDYHEAHYNLAIVLFRSGDLPGAERHFRAATERPQYSAAHNGLGIVLMAQERPGPALLQFEQALRIDPRNAEAHNNLGNLHASQGRHAEAAGHFQQAIRINPDYAAARESLSRTEARHQGE